MVANNICDDFLKKLGEIQNMSLAGEKATQFANCEQFSSFYGVWITELKELGVEQSSMLELSLREYTLSLLFVASGDDFTAFFLRVHPVFHNVVFQRTQLSSMENPSKR